MERREATLPTMRRLALSRLGLTALAGVVAVVLGAFAVRSAARWLDAQPRYQARFRDLVLDPPPPPWYRGGAPVFLDRVREAALLPDGRFSVLDCDLAKLKADFQKYAWVRGVERIRRLPPDRAHPARIVVQLRYAEPVAVAKLRDHPDVLLDAEGVILPTDDVDRERAGPLVPIYHLPPPFAARPGEVWKVEGSPRGVAQTHAGAVGAAKLAGFLKRAVTQDDPGGALTRVLLISFEPGGQGPFVKVGEPKLWLYWGAPPGDEPPGQPDASEKWDMLREWAKANGPDAVKYPNYLRFEGSKLVARRGFAPPSESD